ncbi:MULTISPECIES: TRAP transporter substrate-binding protein DctP [Halomonas]|uniref:C4-dicarboxylate ABC transporter n=2 Tax=Halomonas TaxID=2745 RepID=A0A7X4W062_9GAMM|nr:MULTISPECIES: TRAP transporter substrate-binding protein DctP [Halomonas]MDR5902513.1 TRAP transporter substrate-binding protein DctP [Halomonas icarae]NAW13407.1 C4-dicarboxylate ABC transporter [Halomonas icarae]TDB03272.1 C4-dicarboxylate ABC transporter [Halomonas marinisediminis]
MKSHKLLTTAGIGALMFGMTSAAMADNWRYAHEEYEGDVQDVFAVAFKEYIEENSDHSVQIYRFGELGESDDIMEQTQNGILQFVNQSPGFTGSLIPEAQIFFVPYLLPTDEETVIEFFDKSKAINEMFPELYAEQGLELLQMYPEGEMVVTTDEPIDTVDDFENKKIRVMTNPLLSETYNAFGATPTPLPWGEVYGALQTGILDGQENPIFWIQSGGLYEVSPNLVFTGHGWFTTAMMANQDFFDGLSEEDQQLVRDASEAAYDHTIEHIQGLAEEALNKIKEDCDNCTYTRLDEAQMQSLRERAPQVEEAYVEMAGESGAELLEQFKADLEAVTSDEE